MTISPAPVTWLGEKLWRWEVVGILAPLLYGAGVSAMYGDNYTIAKSLYVAAVVLLTAKVLTWEETRAHKSRRSIGALSLVAAGSVLIASLAWIGHRVQDHRKEIRLRDDARGGSEKQANEPGSKPQYERRDATAEVDKSDKQIPKGRASNKTAAIPAGDATTKMPSAAEIAAEVVKRLPVPYPTIKQEGFHEKIESVTVSLGENGSSTTCPLWMLQPGASMPCVPYSLDGYRPMNLRMEGDQLFFTFSLWGGDGEAPIEIVNNEFVVRRSGWDRNHNENALEVVDGNGTPFFQMIRATPDHLIINGIFQMPSGSIIYASDQGIWPPRSPKQGTPPGFRLVPIFKYPSWKYSGEYADH